MTKLFDQSIWPKLKLLPIIIVEFVCLFILFIDNCSCSNAVPLSEGGL